MSLYTGDKLIRCCNRHFNTSFSYILFSGENFYRRLEFGVCPVCGCPKFQDFSINHKDEETVKVCTGKHAVQKLAMWKKRIQNIRYCNKSNQNVYYGDFKKTPHRDENNIPIYQQLRRNFNGQAEIIGEVKTLILAGV